MSVAHARTRNPRRRVRPSRQRGAAAVEFAMIAIVFLTVVLAIIDFGRWLYTINAAAEATRWGARIAAVCDPCTSKAMIRNKMQAFLPGLTDGQLQLAYLRADLSDAGCSTTDSAFVSVALNGYTVSAVTWVLPAGGLPIPAFQTRLPRESLQSVLDGSDQSATCR
jgi:Flp pilus assembly protein TadG